MNQSLEFLALPEELAQRILSYLSGKDALQAALVNQAWNKNVRYPIYNTIVLPLKFNQDTLWTHLCDYHLQQQATFSTPSLSLPFSEEEHKLWFKKYMLEVFKHNVTVTPLTFLDESRTIFINHQRSRIEEEKHIFQKDSILSRADLLGSWEIYHQRIAYLFNHRTFYQLSQMYDMQTTTWHVKNENHIQFVETLAANIKRLESLFSTFVILHKTNFILSHGNFFPNPDIQPCINLLDGHGIILLDCDGGPNLIEKALAKTKAGNKFAFIEEKPLTPAQIHLILKKLTLTDLIQFVWSNYMNDQVIAQALEHEQPQIYALLFQASDRQLLDFCFKAKKLALAILSYPDLVNRLSNPSLIAIFLELDWNDLLPILRQAYMVARLVSTEFLEIFNDDSFWSAEKKRGKQKLVIGFLLTIPEVVHALPLQTVEALIIKYDIPGWQDKLWSTLADQHKLTVVIFFQLAKNLTLFSYSKKPCVSKYAFQLASQPEVIQSLIQNLDADNTLPYQLLQFALRDTQAQNIVCPLLHNSEIIVKLKKKQLHSLWQSLEDSFQVNLIKSEKENNNNQAITGPNYQCIEKELKRRAEQKQSTQFVHQNAVELVKPPITFLSFESEEPDLIGSFAPTPTQNQGMNPQGSKPALSSPATLTPTSQ